MVSVGGLASGLDTNGIINQLVELERRPIQNLERDIAQLQQVQATFTGLAGQFSGLRAASRNLTLSNLDQPTVSQTNETAATITATSTAVAGSHTLEISRLATSNRIASQGFADSDATPIASSAGSFVIQVGNSGAQINVSVTTATTMDDLASAINAADGDVTASIINDGTNALSSRLVLTSNQTGQGNDIQILTNGTDIDFAGNLIEAASADGENAGTYTGSATSSGTYAGTSNKTFIIETLGAGAVGAATYRVSEDGGVTWDDNGGAGYATSAVAGTIGANTEGVEIAFSAGGSLTAGDRFYVDVSTPTLTEAQDAVFTLDGLVQTRDTNTVTGALGGVTIDLAGVTSTAMSFSIAEDDQRVVSAVEEFVEAYNGLFNAVREDQTFDTETFQAGILLGDRTANTILSELRTTLGRTVENTGSAFTSLASLGITSSRTGGLTLDANSLRDALNDDREGVLAVLASTDSSSSSDLSVSTRSTDPADGVFGVNVSTAPEVASVAAGGAQTDTLGATEVLSFSFSSNNTATTPTTSSFSVTLQAGDTLANVVDRLNSAFATQGVRLRALNNSGTLNIETTEFGADMFFSVASDTASGANTTRLGTGTSSDSGVDIVGSINGEVSTGRGNRLEVDDGPETAGLSVLYRGSSTGFVGSVTISTGLGASFVETVNNLNSGSESVVGGRTSSLQDQIDAIGERIVDREDQVARIQARLEEQFAALEVQLAGLQSQSDFLTNQLSQLGPAGSSGS